MKKLTRGCLVVAFYGAAILAALVGALLVTSVFYVALQIALCC